jgi:HPt (histidine-containing phosphotransfer) domain-containing protein
MSALKDFFGSEKGVWGLLLPMLGASGMLIAGELDAQQWIDFTQVMVGIYVGGKTVQGSAAAFSSSRQVAGAAREEQKLLEEKLAKNDAQIDKLVAEMANEKKRYAATAEG